MLDEWLSPVAIGVTGDLYYAGGAIDDAAAAASPAAASRYPANPFGNGYLYRTGDRARWTADGELQYLESGDPEVQAALEAMPGVAAALTRTWETRSGQVLAGYVVLSDPGAESGPAPHCPSTSRRCRSPCWRR